MGVIIKIIFFRIRLYSLINSISLYFEVTSASSDEEHLNKDTFICQAKEIGKLLSLTKTIQNTLEELKWSFRSHKK